MIELNNVTTLLVDTVTMAVDNTVISAAEATPGIVAGIIIFIIGWVFALIISRLFSGLLKAMRLEQFLKDHKLGGALGTVKLSDVLVKLLKYYIILLFLQAAMALVELGTMSDFMTAMLAYAPVLIGSSLIVLLSVLLGQYVKEVIKELSKSPVVKFIARATKLLVIYIGITTALATAKFDTTLITSIFITILQAMVFGIALAIGIAFGLGGQGEAKDAIGKMRKHLKI